MTSPRESDKRVSLQRIAVVIPAGTSEREPNLAGLLEDTWAQTTPPEQVRIIRGVSPNGRARNVGVEQTDGEILVFLDDDVRLGSRDILEKFLECLSDPAIGLAGTSQLLPPGSTPFQSQCARQLSRSESAVVEQVTDSDMVTTQCCAVRRQVFEQVGGFHSQILRGVDPEFRQRIRRAGYRICVVPQAWHYHPMPENLGELRKMAWRNGYASAYAQLHFPETTLHNPEGHVAEFQARVALPQRLVRRALQFLGRVRQGQWIGIIYDIGYAAGYLRCLLGPRGRPGP